MPHRETLLDAGNVKQFAAEQGIESFPALESYAQAQEKSYKETERRLLSDGEKPAPRLCGNDPAQPEDGTV